MTDILDDEVVQTSKSGARRPMFIETEVRTDTVTRRRVGSTQSNRSVHDILENTKSPTDGLPPTTYTYAHSASYMPVTQNASYNVPVMARRDLHGEYRPYGGSSSFSLSSNSVISSPARLVSNVRSQLVNSYSALRDRLTHHSSSSQQQQPGSISTPRYSRSSSQSSTSAQGRNYNSRQRAPAHSTPRDVDYKQRKSEDGEQEDNQGYDYNKDEKSDEDKENFIVRLVKKILYLPFKILSFIWHKFFGLPWWLLIPLLLFLGIYAFPNLACKPFEHYPESKIYQNCRKFQEYANNVTNNSVNYLRQQTFSPGIAIIDRIWQTVKNFKDYVFNKIDDVYVGIRKFLRKQYNNVFGGIKGFFVRTKEGVEGYCDEGVRKAQSLVDDMKSEIAKLRGTGHALDAHQEEQLDALIRKVIDDYAADETGLADYALEANGGKVVDTRCTEYTDEPRQNVVKFLGIPIVHMSKQPNIMIKVGRMPGQCFPFKGDQGSVVIKLAVPVKPTEFVLEHLSRNISVVGHINSAPNNFTVYALKDKNDKEGVVLGRYFYDAENGPSLQRFKPQLVNVPIVEYIEVRVTSNWGNPNYTCLYRFRVHGNLQDVQPSAPPAA